MEPEANSIEIMSYTYDGSNRTFVDLSNYHEWWICPPAMNGITLFADELLGTQGITFLADAGAFVKIHSVGNVWITGYAALWVTLDGGPGQFSVMGIRRR